ncbi:MAG: hypothetical protein NT062_19285 [Proteobacteria bacterium]|nr:hypothetical protein [Pseudomonadota bacterium]
MKRWLATAVMIALPAVTAAAPVAPDPTEPTEPTEEPTEPIATPIATPVAAPIVPATEVDLSGLDLDPTPADEKISLYGFADVSWRAMLMPRSSIGANYIPKENSFLVGNVDLYVTKKLSSHWRSLLEVRYLYAPIEKTADGSYASTTAPDPADLERPIQWGGISIERIYLEYEINEWLTVQAGSFLTPYGIWNVDHGSPAIIPVTRPYIIGESLFPQQQTGLHLYGRAPLGDYQLRYDATFTNGRGPFQAVRDLDDNKAIGARVELETPWLDGVHLGLSGYRGRYTDRPADVIVANASGMLVNTTPMGTRYDELAWGADVLVRRGGLHVQAEVIGNDRHYLPGAREITRGGFVPDGWYLGAYALVGYRFDRWWQVMPFAVFEVDRMRPSVELGSTPVVIQATAGLNFRPDPSVALKIGYVHVHVDTAIDLDLQSLMTQATWAF